MRSKSAVWWCILVGLCLVCLATGVMASTYTWTGADETDPTAWALAGNWSGFCSTPCYPSSTNDDATFPSPADEDDLWTCDLITEEIDDLTINDNIDFAGASDPVLTVDSLTINGATAATVTNGAAIETK